MSNVELKGLVKSFGRTAVLKNVSLSVASGSFVGILGPSGCGKTTLLRIVAGLETVGAGSVEIAGKDVTDLPPEDRDISMMFQSYALLPHLSVLENVRFPLRMRRLGSRSEQLERARAALDLVQLGAVADRRPHQLSGGQQQRVALARAVAPGPAVLLLDEPLSNLDARLREDMQVELIELHRKLGLTTLLVTHDQEEALSLSDRVVLLHDGAVERSGTPAEVYADPGSAFASSFLGAANLLPVTVEEGPEGPLAQLKDAPGIAVPLPKGEIVSGLLMIRQEDVILLAPGEPARGPSWEARIETRVFLGGRTRLIVALDGVRLKCLLTGSLPQAEGERVRLTFRFERLAMVTGA